MADLRYIMDVADDEDLGNDKYSRQPNISGSARSPNPSSTTKQSDDSLPPPNPDPSKSQLRRRGPLSRPSRPTTTVSPTTASASADKASPSRHPFVERRSVDSTESMDPASYGSYAQSSSSNMPPSSRSNVSSRPMSSTPGESNIPVKLTPITGRVSRAKKGVPVHTCEICKPPKLPRVGVPVLDFSLTLRIDDINSVTSRLLFSVLILAVTKPFTDKISLRATLKDSHLSQESNWPSSASGSPYSTPDRAMIRGYESPNTDVANTDIFYVPQYPSPQQPVYNPVSDYTSYPDDTSYYDFQSHPFPVRSPTPPTVTLSAQPAENLVTLGHSVPDPSAVLGRRKGLVALMNPYSDAALLPTLAPSAAALNAIPRYLDVYWKRFDTLFPLVHRRSLQTAADPVLRCAMAALGSQFLQSKEDRINSHILHGLASQEARLRPQWSVDVMQAILLCEFYGRFRGSRAMARPSEPFQSLYSRVAAPHTSVEHDAPTGTSHRHWDDWIRAESRRRLLAASFVLDIHTSMYHEHSTLHNFPTPPLPIPLIKSTQRLWAAEDLEAWQEISSSDPAQLKPATPAEEEEEITPDQVSTALPLDSAVYLASETLRLPRRSSASALDVSADLDLGSTKRMCDLFSGSPVANTYLALHYTPLRDLLAVSGDSWLFSRKILDPEDFQRRKVIVRSWSNSVHAGAASIFAAKALLAFLDTNDDTPNDYDLTGGNRKGDGPDMSEISDYWALYVCALICWSLGHRTTRGADGTGFSLAAARNNSSASSKGAIEAKRWLRMLASWSPEAAAQNMRARRETLGVIAIVRRRLESETAGGKSKLLVDAVRVLKSLEQDPNRGRF
ncbi:hypothetical protein EKO27_g7476 [Xylaria grammica]|uniref:Xylanolytic transcriptional activator regulatory domain-containing protein n=1 Tax=Xylaria grammica TaxID=363999 RepID=A0A439CZI4_9PEZI|nr:hypothetical protein EKO27_g7476 [Xylaria grammica]